MKRLVLLIAAAAAAFSCSPSNAVKTAGDAPIWPDYAEVTVPATIAPLDFGPAENISASRIYVTVSDASGKTLGHFGGKEAVKFPIRWWHKTLAANDNIQMIVSIKSQGKWNEYAPFPIHISKDAIDYGLTYRLIMAGYQSFGHLGIYERDLSSFKQRTLIDNRMVDDGCLNCHTPSRTDPSFANLHVRGEHSATLLRHDGTLECLNTITDTTGGFFVYPYWHPSNRFIAYSVNKTRLSFYTHTDKKLEVYDQNSDLLVYEPSTHQIYLCDKIRQKDKFETYPAFSPDGKTLYFCVSQAGNLPKEMAGNQYSLCSIGFDGSDGSFGEKVDTLIDGPAMDLSFSTPRPSFDGKYVMLAGTKFGTFPLWHPEADLWLYSVADGTLRNISELNSDAPESFHNWSSDSKWVVFSSRREDGLYTRLYIAHMDENGNFGKPFLLPQKNPRKYYDELMYSYNIPDFTSVSVPFDVRGIRKMLLSKERTPVCVK